MKVFTVVHLSGDNETSPFAFSYRTLNSAVQAVEQHAVELHGFRVDPNSEDDQSFPGLDWSDDMRRATERQSGSDGSGEYWITETELQ